MLISYPQARRLALQYESKGHAPEHAMAMAVQELSGQPPPPKDAAFYERVGEMFRESITPTKRVSTPKFGYAFLTSKFMETGLPMPVAMERADQLVRKLEKNLRNANGREPTMTASAQHMAAYSDADNRLILSIPLDKQAALADGDENKRVWVQVGKAGRWLGHRQGPFELNSQIFDSIVRNFRSQNVGRLQYDFEHASEMKPTDGMIPMVGVPAQGWIYDLKHDGRALYALTEWKDLARQYIENDQYQGVSPAISWKNNDRVSGQPIGPMLTSVALTNKPFLTGMRPPQAASAEGVTWLTADAHPAPTRELPTLTLMSLTETFMRDGVTLGEAQVRADACLRRLSKVAPQGSK